MILLAFVCYGTIFDAGLVLAVWFLTFLVLVKLTVFYCCLLILLLYVIVLFYPQSVILGNGGAKFGLICIVMLLEVWLMNSVPSCMWVIGFTLFPALIIAVNSGLSLIGYCWSDLCTQVYPNFICLVGPWWKA